MPPAVPPAPVAADRAASSLEVVRRALAEARAALGMDVAWFAQFVGDRLLVRALDGDGGAFGLTEDTTFPLEDTFCAKMASGGLRCWVPDVAADPVAAAVPAAAIGIGAYLGVPVHHADGRLYGSFCCASLAPRPELDERDARLLRALGGVVASQLDQDRHYKELLESSRDPVLVADLEGRTVFANQPLADLLGVTREEVVRRTAFGFLAPAEAERARASLGRRGAGQMERYELVFTRPDGREVPTEVSSAPLSAPDGEVIGAVATILDLSTRKEAERLSDERFRWLADLVPEQVWIADAEGNLLFASQKVRQFYGLDADWTHTAQFFAHVHPQDAERARAEITDGRATGRPYAVEMRLRRHDGEYRPHLASGFPVLDREGRLVRSYGITADLTEQRAQERLLLSEAELREAQRIARLGSFHADLARGTMTVSEELEALLGFEPGAFDGRLESFLARIHPDDAADVRRVTEGAAARCGEWSRDHRLLLPEGDVRVVRARGRFLPGPDGRAAELAGTVQDVTEQRAAEAAARGREAAERASAAKSEFLSRMSHELRTPLNAVLGFGQLLELDPLSDDQRDSVGHILGAGAHLLELIDEVLEISRIEAGAMRLSLEPVAVAEAVAEVVALVAPLAAERQIALRVNAEAGLCARADFGRLKQILLNLLSNAIKYNRHGGQATVRVRRHRDGRIRVAVSDTGLGLRPDELERVFSPFERLGADAGHGPQGTGLGLAVSRSLAEAMGGELAAASVEGCGSDFFLLLDAEAAADPAVGTRPPARPAGLISDPSPERYARVLCIEDNPANLRLVERILEPAGIEVLGADLGALGLERARRDAPELILLDLDLPDVGGEEVLLRLAADPATAEIPVVVCSADATPATVARVRELGARAYLTKPVSVDDLLKAVGRPVDEVMG